MELNVTLVVSVLFAIIGLVLIIIGIYCLIRRYTAKPRRRADLVDKSKNNKDIIINVTNHDQDKSSNGLLKADDAETSKFLGVSLSEIPFIDDSKCSSYVDLTSWSPNPYKPLTNSA